ncbi:AAA family ATPase [Klebsiella pneumoniae]|nr:AAA family ATPase [Klebsiella pneumoniae]
MDLMKIKINNIKNIKNADIELPIEGGLYSLVGGNGCGKSTLMLIMSVLLSSKRFNMLQDEDFDDNSTIDVTISADDYEESNHWFVKKDREIMKICGGALADHYHIKGFMKVVCFMELASETRLLLINYCEITK